MLSAFVTSLREGVEAALIVGIILVYLSRTGRSHLARFVWGGVAAAVALSLATAMALDHFNISSDGFEGLLLLVAAFFVVSMIVWMNRAARHLKKEIEAKVDTYASRGSGGGWAIGFFVFLMVLREGAELALILRAVELSTEGLQTWIGTLAGIALAIAVGLFFFKGTLKIPLHKFFSVTSAILMLVAFQLALTGLHELSEARWLPSSKTEMAILGPIVRNELFFFVFIFGAAAFMIFREWRSSTHAKALSAATTDADRRLLEAQNRRQNRWMISSAVLSLLVILVLTADFIYAQANSAPPEAHPVTPVNNIVRIPVSEVQDGNLHLFTYKTADGQAIRFMVIKKPNGYGTALDACLICGAEGYRQDGQNVICRHCASAIYVPTIGQKGGCNPIGFSSQVEGDNVAIDVSALSKAAQEIPK